MRNRGHTVNGTSKIRQHIRSAVIGPRRKSAAALARIRHHVYPVLVKALLHNPAVFLAKRRHCLFHHFLSLLKGVADIHIPHQRRIHVIIMQLIQA